ncbi:unnamed protein product [Prunus armeniaca]
MLSSQSHLLGMKRNSDPAGNPMSFTELVISDINILSGLYLNKNFSSSSEDEKSFNLSNGSKNASEKSSLKTRLNSSRYGSSSGTSSQLNGGTCTVSRVSRKDAGLSQRSYISEDPKIDLLEESQDPFCI